MDNSKQQPVAEVYYGNYGGNTRGIGFVGVRPLVSADELPPPGTKLYVALTAPRDVLMAALYELSDVCLELNGNGIGCDVISAIADRYSDEIQLVELEKDTARLNFIEKRHDMRLSTRNGKWWAFDKFSNYEQATYTTLREAIDAAMQSAAQKPESF